MPDQKKQLQQLFQRHGNVIHASQILAAGVHPRELYAMRDRGELQLLARGLYRPSDLPPMTEPDLVTVAAVCPRGVICLISALAFHGLTTQIPHAVHLAIARTMRPPTLTFPPLRVFRFAPDTFSVGIEEHRIDGLPICIYSVEKTLADCFKYRNKIGIDVALEALHSYRQTHRGFQAVLEFARACRVEKVMTPYLEALA